MSDNYLHLKCDGPSYQNASLVDADGKHIEGVISADVRIVVGEINQATVRLHGVTVDTEIDPDFVIDYGDDIAEIPLPRGLTVDQAQQIRGMFSSLVGELRREIGELRDQMASRVA